MAAPRLSANSTRGAFSGARAAGVGASSGTVGGGRLSFGERRGVKGALLTIASPPSRSPFPLSMKSNSKLVESVHTSFSAAQRCCYSEVDKRRRKVCGRVVECCTQGKGNEAEPEILYPCQTTTSLQGGDGVPVFMMLPLNAVSMDGQVSRRSRRAMNVSMMALKSAGVQGIMLNVWWGIVERHLPCHYNWAPYLDLLHIASTHSLKVQAVLSFHQSLGISLPDWVCEEIAKNPDLCYTDKRGKRNPEYISLGCDTLPVLRGRTPIQVYSDFMRSFRDAFRGLLGHTIVEVQLGMGPGGEFRYPSYDSSWQFPGIGEFQCYDKYMRASLKACADEVGKYEWGMGGPDDAGEYKQCPEETAFFKTDGSWKSPYGQFFLGWYSSVLLMHGKRISAAAEAIFRSTGAKLSGKLGGIHWHHETESHSAELTAGYFNTCLNDGYLPIAQMFGRHGVTLCCTCFEMRDAEQKPLNANCSPEGFLRQVTVAALKSHVPLAGENSVTRFDELSQNQIIKNSRLSQDDNSTCDLVCSFSFLRMSEKLFQRENWNRFVQFVRRMADGTTFHLREDNNHGAKSKSQDQALRKEADVSKSCQ